MRLVSEFVTLDGVMEDPGGAEGFDRGGWAFKFERGPEGDKYKLDELQAADALLLGRRTYEGFAAAWPSRTGDEFSDKMNAMPKYVISKTLHDPTWNNTTVLIGDAAHEVEKLKAQPGGDLLVAGSGDLVHELEHHNLVDEYRLMVFPIILGAGRRLFRGGGSSNSLKVVETKQTGEVLIITLQPPA